MFGGPGLSLVPESVALRGDRHDICVTQQPIEQCSGQRVILREGAVPLPERQVAGHDQAGL